jgi:hypothetical protein
MKDRIRELLAYSFMDNGQVIPYINLTTREKIIITEDEYDEVIMFIRGEIDLYSPPRLRKNQADKDAIFIDILKIFLVSLAVCTAYHLIFN